MIDETFSSFLIYITFLIFAYKRLTTYLHAFQQEEYDAGRFIKWVFSNKVFDKRASAIVIIAGIGYFFLPWFVSDLLVMIAFGYGVYKEKDPKHDAKKKLAMTNRAKRIYYLACAFSFPLGMFLIFDHMPIIWLPIIQFLPFALVIANGMLQPFEDTIQKRYWREANDKIKNSDVKIIGITGSFGKTSVKHILGHILSREAPTLITPGSVNTPMGVARVIREELNDTHKYFIVEMGAYGHGSIERMCKLAPPDYGIITAIGHAHYERFKSLEAVAETKSELAEAVIQNDGQIIVDYKVLKFDYAKTMKDENIGKFISTGDSGMADLVVEETRQTPRGLDIRLRWDDGTYVMLVPLYGVHHVDNIAASFAMACTLGIAPESVVRAMESVPQIPHRLQVKPKQHNGSTFIDDAYNSNPSGFQSALDLLEILGKDKRKILVTPGIVELGRAHNEVHKAIGNYAVAKCDVALVVNPKRIQSFVKAYRFNGGKDLHEFDTFDDAQRWLVENLNENDVVLIENDLPDIYERLPKI